MALTARTFEYAVEVDTGGRMTIPGGGQLVMPEGWSADHLLLAALVRCSIASLAYHARRAGHTSTASGSAHGRITRAGEDDRFRFVEIVVQIDVHLDPPLHDPHDLLARAERDCFVSASLRLEPEYEWRVF